MHGKSDTNPLLQAALAYATANAKRPLKVFPIKPGEKKSRIAARYAKDRARWGMTSDIHQVTSYWKRWPDSNIGLPTGEVNGFFVVEVDTVQGHEKLKVDGQVSLDKLIAEHGGEWPETRTVRSPSGSKHFYFAQPPGRTVKNSSGELGEGIDVRGDGGMVIAPPSVNPKYPDQCYEVINPNKGIVAAPQWLLDIVCEEEGASHQSGDAQAPIEKLHAAMRRIPNDHAGVVWSFSDEDDPFNVREMTGFDGWAKIGLALFRATGGSDEGFAIFDEWSARNRDKYDRAATRERWYVKFASSPPSRVGAGTIFMLANEVQPNWSRDWDREHADAEDGLLVSADHMERARQMRAKCFPHLVHYRDSFMNWRHGCYHVVDDGDISATLWTMLDTAMVKKKTGRGKNVEFEIVPFSPDRNSVNETIAALKAVAHLDADIAAPCWLSERDDLPAEHVISFPNGLLDLRTNKLHQPDPNFFTTAALAFDYTPTAPQPQMWLKFLAEILEGDDCAQQITLLQETFGYLLTADTSLQKAFFFLGPPRSGKGTILGVLRKLLAATSVAGPSLKSLGTNFGLQPLIGKQVAIIDDLRVGKPSEQDVLIENMLKITGEGFFTIDRKYKDAWHGALPVKLVLISNVMPKLGDDSSAIASRFVIVMTRVSFLGKEDHHLLAKLQPELLGIFHWALEGLRRLRERGHLTETSTSRDAGERLANLGSPAMAFLSECCELDGDPKSFVEKDDLYTAWKDYAEENDLFPGTAQKFFEALYAAGHGRLRPGRPRVGNRQVYAVMGLKLREYRNEFQEVATGRPPQRGR